MLADIVLKALTLNGGEDVAEFRRRSIIGTVWIPLAKLVDENRT